MLTALDVGIGVLVLISALLATARGLTREILSLATWAGSAAFAIYMWQFQPQIARGFIAEALVADIATVVVSFIVALIVLHLLTMRIADFVVDSKIGPLDRSLGFIFGVLRGILIAVVIVIFGSWLLGATGPGGQDRLPVWARDSRSLPVLENFGDQLIALLPEDLERQVIDILQRGTGADDTPPLEDGTDGPEDGSPLPLSTTNT
jgi:membrane protein required for colicin V production